MPKTTIIHNHTDLTEIHTFGVPWKADYFVSIQNESEIPELVSFAKSKKLSVLILGGGSNILPTKTFKGLVIQNSILGIEKKETKTHHVLSVGAGEDWTDFVSTSIKDKMVGLENLSLIPGSVGGAVVQNIGAYDIDIARYVDRVEAYSLKTGEKKVFKHQECKFEYRNSLFKQNKTWLVTRLVLKLPKKFKPVLTYKGLQDLAKNKKLSAAQVAKRVIQERNKKLPDPSVVGTAGSFFKNPRVSKVHAAKLKLMFPDIPLFNNYGSKAITIPAGWLIEHSIDKKTKTDFLYPHHNLVLINKTKGKKQIADRGKKIFSASQKIQQLVLKKFNIALVPEVIII